MCAQTIGHALDVSVVGTRAYVADDFSGRRGIDVSNPSLPVEIGAIDTPVYANLCGLWGGSPTWRASTRACS